MVAAGGAGLAADHAAEHWSGLVAVHRVTGGAAFGEKLLSMDCIRRGVSLEPRKILGLIRIYRAQQRIAERNRVDMGVVGIFRKSRIDIEHDGHFDFLMRVEALLVETEALNLIEIEAARLGRDVERRVRHDRLVAEIFRGEEYQLLFAEVNGHGAR